jgi:hypothetical protein
MMKLSALSTGVKTSYLKIIKKLKAHILGKEVVTADFGTVQLVLLVSSCISRIWLSSSEN